MEKIILYESGSYFVLGTPKGHFEVYKSGVCAAERCAYIGYEGGKGLARAIEECGKRTAHDLAKH